MGLLKGNFGLQVFEVTGTFDKDAIFEKLESLAFRPGGPQDEQVFGTCDVLDNNMPPQEDSTILSDKWIAFGVRVDRKSVPKALLNAEYVQSLRALPQGTILSSTDKRDLKDRIREKLLPSIPAVPRFYSMALDLDQKALYCEGSFDWISSQLGTIGIRAFSNPYIPTPEAMKKVRDNVVKEIDLPKDAPEQTSSPVSLTADGKLVSLECDERKITFRGDGLDGEEECDNLISAGANIVQLSAIINLEHANFDVKLQVNSNRVKSNFPIKFKGNAAERLQFRLTVLRALTYSLQQVRKLVS
jgi:hypothetical protein